MSRLLTRLQRLEQTQKKTEYQPRYVVVCDDEPLPEDLRVTDRVICLPNKAESEAAWLEQVRQMGFGPGRQGGGRDATL